MRRAQYHPQQTNVKERRKQTRGKPSNLNKERNEAL